MIITRDLQPKLAKLKYNFLENMINCCMSVPLYVGESHGMRFNDFKLAVATLEKAMQGCNKMIVYLEQVVGVYGSKLDQALIEDLMHRYMDVRGKMWRLEKSWKKYRDENNV